MDHSEKQEIKLFTRFMIIIPEIANDGTLEVQDIANAQLYMRNGGCNVSYSIVSSRKCGFSAIAENTSV